jgi:polyphosphate kinase 2
MNKKKFEKELKALQVELCALQDWVKRSGARVIVVFEGRDTAGKGGVIKSITARVSPRVFRVVALPAPSDREKSQLFIQRYVPHFPAAGEVVIFDRSWYNRLAVEPVLGFCSEDEYRRFLGVCAGIEEHIVEEGIILIKYFLDVSAKEQEKRLRSRLDDPLKHWKLSPMDVKSWSLWKEYTDYYNAMFAATDTEHAPWFRVAANDKRTSRLNCISHLLDTISYEAKAFELPDLPPPRDVRKKHSKLRLRQSVPEKY